MKMVYSNNSFFTGKLKGKTLQELNKEIDYTKSTYDERLQVIEDILETGFYEEYMDEHFKVNINSSDSLSDSDAVCSSLERMANYLLNSDEVKEMKKDEEFEYKFYSDEEAFNKAVNKEPKIEGMASVATENVIHFLKQENRNNKLSKNQKITKQDMRRGDELGEILCQYDDYLKKVTKELNNYNSSQLSRFNLSIISGSLKQDMIDSKNILLGAFGFKTNHQESTVVDWSQADFTKYYHSRAMLYLEPRRRADEDLQYLVDEFNVLYKEANPTELQKKIVRLLRKNYKITDIGLELGISKQRVEKNISMLVIRICRKAGVYYATYRD